MTQSLLWPAGVASARARAQAIGDALAERARATHEAEVEYSETVQKLRERFEADLADARDRYRRAVTPAHRAANAAIMEVEYSFARRGLDAD